MIALHEKFIVNAQGHKTEVVLDIAEYEQLLELLEELEDLRAFDAALADPSEAISLAQALAEIEAGA